MRADLAKTTALLTGQLRQSLDATDLAVAEPLLKAFENGRAWFECEDWHDVQASEDNNEKPRCELLLRAKDEFSHCVNLTPIFHIIQQQGLYPCFDQLVVLSAVAQSIREDKFPVSINISSLNACDAESLNNLHTQLRQHFGDDFSPADIAFELLEGDDANNTNDSALKSIKALGYKLAIDDASHEHIDMARILNLSPYADYIKIDGKTMNACKDGTLYLGSFVEDLRKLAPQAEFVCEWIESAEEAADLHSTLPGIHYVQGRDLIFGAKDFTARLGAAVHPYCSRFQIGPPLPPEIK